METTDYNYYIKEQWWVKEVGGDIVDFNYPAYFKGIYDARQIFFKENNVKPVFMKKMLFIPYDN